MATMAQYRLNLAPLRFGAGLKGKVFDGFLSGTPTVMSPIAAEGIFSDEALYQLQAENLAAEAVRLYSSESSWYERCERMEAVFCERFDQRRWYAELPQILSEASDNIDPGREANFIGRMLRHHQHRSTEFMSRWIQVKNGKNAL